MDALGNKRTTTYDLLGRATGATDPLGHTTVTGYDELGRRTSSTDPKGNTTSFGYDDAGRVTSVTDALLGVTRYEYDARGNRTKVTDANNHDTVFTYDRANRLLTETTPIGSVTAYTYDLAGNRIRKLDGDNLTTEYVYDANRRLTKIVYNDLSEENFTYDIAGQRLTEQNVDIARTMTYDALGRVATVLDHRLNKTLAYEYDTSGNRAKMTVVEEGEATSYVWDLAGRLRELKDPEGEVTRFDYDALGRRTLLAHPNKVQGSWLYDQASQILSIVWAGPSGNVLQSFGYAYDAAGNRLSKAMVGGAEVYGYDKLNRLISAAYPSGRQVTYDYDPVGNRREMIETGSATAGTTTYAYNAFNQLLTLTGPQGPTTFTYDARGNQRTKAEPSGTTSYTFDVRNRLTQVSTPTAGAAVYSYDSQGLRVAMNDAEGDRRILLDGVEEFAEYDSSDARTRQNEHDPMRVDGLLSQNRLGVRSYHLVDAIGSIYAATNALGGLSAVAAYDVYGARSGGVPSDWGFAGRRHDSNRIVYARARYLDTALGRLTQEDPVNLRTAPLSLAPFEQELIQQYNRYQYALANPARFTDPDGRFVGAVPGLVVGAFLGAAIGAYAGWVLCGVGSGGILDGAIIGAFVGAILGLGLGIAINLRLIVKLLPSVLSLGKFELNLVTNIGRVFGIGWSAGRQAFHWNFPFEAFAHVYAPWAYVLTAVAVAFVLGAIVLIAADYYYSEQEPLS